METINKIDYIKLFISSSAYVFKQELKINHIKRRELSVVDKPRLSFPILGVISFEGTHIKGKVIYSVAKSFMESITARMLPDKLPHDRRRLQNSCLGELVNMISGRVTIAVAGNNKVIHMTPPVIINQADTTPKFNFINTKILVLLLDSPIGSVEVNIGIEES